MANQYAHHKIVVTSYSEVQIPSIFAWGHIPRHLCLPYLLSRRIAELHENDLVIVREFTTIPLLLALPVLWRFRRTTAFVIVHNLQMAHIRWRDRIALKMLFAVGLRFIALESAAGFKPIGISPRPGQLLVLPHCIGAEARLRNLSNLNTKSLVLGVIGRLRAGKGIDRLLDVIEQAVESGKIQAEVLVGCPDKAILEDCARRGFRILDTTSEEAYERALDLCDINLLNYEAKQYFYRGSGVIADTISRGTAVVCPDYPVFRAQVCSPVDVGATYESLADLPRAIAKACTVIRSGTQPFRDYVAHRSPKRIAALIDGFIEHSSHHERPGI